MDIDKKNKLLIELAGITEADAPGSIENDVKILKSLGVQNVRAGRGAMSMASVKPVDGAWITGKMSRNFAPGSEIQIKRFDEPSGYGIKGSRISKLWISEPTDRSGGDQASYDRGWDVKPTDPRIAKWIDRLVQAFK